MPKLKTKKFKYATEQAYIKSLLDDVIELEDQLSAHKRLHQETVTHLLSANEQLESLLEFQVGVAHAKEQTIQDHGWLIEKLREENKTLTDKLKLYQAAWEKEFG